MAWWSLVLAALATRVALNHAIVTCRHVPARHTSALRHAKFSTRTRCTTRLAAETPESDSDRDRDLDPDLDLDLDLDPGPGPGPGPVTLKLTAKQKFAEEGKWVGVWVWGRGWVVVGVGVEDISSHISYRGTLAPKSPSFFLIPEHGPLALTLTLTLTLTLPFPPFPFEAAGSDPVRHLSE